MEALIHLFVLLYLGLLRLITRRKPVTYIFNCPHCQELQVVKMYESVKVDEKLRPVSAERVFKCQKCTKSFDAESFHVDADGVFQMKTWDCPQCAHLNPNSTFLCKSCGFKLV